MLYLTEVFTTHIIELLLRLCVQSNKRAFEQEHNIFACEDS